MGFVQDRRPLVIPMFYVRIGGQIFLHGSRASRALKVLATGVEACVTVTLLDGLVLARSLFHHSMNYRSVVLFGTGEAVEDPARKAEVFRALSDHVAPGRFAEVRPPTEAESRQTLVVGITIREGSAKVRTGPPLDDEADYALPVWAGVLPLRLTALEPVSDANGRGEVPVPAYLTDYRRPVHGPGAGLREGRSAATGQAKNVRSGRR